MTSTGKKPAARAATPKVKPAIPSIEKEIIIAAPIEKVWEALTDEEAIGEWMDDDDASVDLKVGGKYVIFSDDTTGHFTAIEKPSVLEYTWRMGEWKKSMPDTLVRWELVAAGKKTKVKLIHSGFTDMKNRDDHDDGWDVYFLEPMNDWLEGKK